MVTSDIERCSRPATPRWTSAACGPEHIAERIAAYRKRGVDLILGGLVHLREEAEYFGSWVLPLVREIEAAEEDSADRRVLAQA